MIGPALLMAALSPFLGADPALPDPLRFADGERHATAETWPERRAEIVEQIQMIEYGTIPPAPEPFTPTIISEERVESFDGRTRDAIAFTFGPDAQLTMRLEVHHPNNIEPPYPVIVRFGMGSEHASAANERGYAFVCLEQTLLDPDTEGHDVAGPAQVAYPRHTWGSLAVWAWGASRVMDYLETRDDIDIHRSVITGHSRTGKAALLAGALDQRFAVVVPNGSGAGGAALFRGAGEGEGRGAETLELITRASRFKSWFHADFGDWAERENELPFDQHFLRALVAPRVVLNTDAFDDTWAHPLGTQRAWRAAQPVFELLGAPDRNLIHIREGGHDQLAQDFGVLLDVADAVFGDHTVPGKFRAAPYPGAH